MHILQHNFKKNLCSRYLICFYFRGGFRGGRGGGPGGFRGGRGGPGGGRGGGAGWPSGGGGGGGPGGYGEIQEHFSVPSNKVISFRIFILFVSKLQKPEVFAYFMHLVS